MNHIDRLLILRILLLTCACFVGRAAEVDAWDEKPTFSVDPQHTVACQNRLNRIYGALQRYYQTYQQFPKQLSDLQGEFLHDPEDLVCPYVSKTGDLTGWRLKVDQTVFDDPGTSYAYEFSDKLCRWAPNLRFREVKQIHLKFFGFGLPIVRCFAHRPRLNLAYGGTVYQSDFEWEDAYLPCREQRNLFHDNLSDTNFLTTKLVAAVKPSWQYFDLTEQQLILTNYYNAPLFHLCRMDPRGQLLTTHPLSVESIGGVLFDVRGLIHLGGRMFPIAFPQKVEGIKVNVHSDRLHLLHGLVQSPHVPLSALVPGSTNAVYSIRFANGDVTEFSIVYGKDVKSLWSRPDEPGDEGEAKPAWSYAPPGSRSVIRLFLTTWQNPHPDRLIQTISIRSTSTNCAPFLAGLTAD